MEFWGLCTDKSIVRFRFSNKSDYRGACSKTKDKTKNSRLNLTSIGEVNSIAKLNVEISVMSRLNSTQFFSIVLGTKFNYGHRRIYTTNWNIPKNIFLADLEYYKPQKVDLLIGGEMLFELLCVGQIKYNPSLSGLQKTSLGWIVAGRYNQPKDSCKHIKGMQY
ncbi:hypothetical protein CVS40_11656 [Lucilia cuprina]|nr:hypothetical protein CVS40_11656 [Lucilia cuprina]